MLNAMSTPNEQSMSNRAGESYALEQDTSAFTMMPGNFSAAPSTFGDNTILGNGYISPHDIFTSDYTDDTSTFNHMAKNMPRNADRWTASGNVGTLNASFY